VKEVMKHLSIVAGVALLSLCLANRLGAGSRSTALLAQQPATSTPAPAFEAASVKPSDPSASGPLANIPLILPPVGGRFSATNVPLRFLIRTAWQLQDVQVEGGPPWMSSNRYDILATAGSGFTGGLPEILPMVRTLVIERFKLKVRMETRQLPVYSLVVARDDRKLGDKLKPSTADCGAADAEMQKRLEALGKGGLGALASLLPRNGETLPCTFTPSGVGGFRGEGQRMATLVQLLTPLLGRPVHDKTGLAGRYDFELTFDPSIFLQLAAQQGVVLLPGITLPPSDNPSLTAALHEQLGLKLESAREPMPVLIIEGAELPEAN
jgi:uncharacterized protein (TIGR03435 family)